MVAWPARQVCDGTRGTHRPEAATHNPVQPQGKIPTSFQSALNDKSGNVFSVLERAEIDNIGRFDVVERFPAERLGAEWFKKRFRLPRTRHAGFDIRGE